jgi:hypothetical protein
MHVSPSQVPKCICCAMHAHAYELLQIFREGCHICMMLVHSKRFLTLSLQVLLIQIFMSKINRKEFQIERSRKSGLSASNIKK